MPRAKNRIKNSDATHQGDSPIKQYNGVSPVKSRKNAEIICSWTMRFGISNEKLSISKFNTNIEAAAAYNFAVMIHREQVEKAEQEQGVRFSTLGIHHPNDGEELNSVTLSDEVQKTITDWITDRVDEAIEELKSVKSVKSANQRISEKISETREISRYRRVHG